MQEAQLPIDVFHWFLAFSPLLILLVFLIALRWKAPEAGPLGMFIAAAIAIFFYQTPAETLAVAGGKGVWDAFFILYVVWPALLLYRITERAGAFDALRKGIERFSSNDLFLVLAFGWVFASFLQGISGFGAPIAVAAPLLIAFGVRPLYAVAIPLIGHAWANMFGTLSVAWLATLQVIELENQILTAFQTAILLWIPNLASGFAIAWLFGRMAAVRVAWPMILIISSIHGGGQLGLVLWDPVLSAFLASSLALIMLYPLSRWSRYDERAEEITEKPAMKEYQTHEEADNQKKAREKDSEKPIMGLWMAGLPYVILTFTAIFTLVIPPVEGTLEQVEIGLPFPAVETGYGLENEAEEPYSPFTPLTHPGTFLLIAAIAAWVIYRSKGYYAEWAKRKEPENIWTGLTNDAVPASIAIVTFLVMSKLMDHSGQTEVLALGIAEVTSAPVFAFASNWIGVLGAFMTSSNAASNILFAPLQQETAQAVEALSEVTIIGSQSAGAALGNSISPANVVLGTGTAGIIGNEGDVLRKTLPWALGVAVLIGGATILLNTLNFI